MARYAPAMLPAALDAAELRWVLLAVIGAVVVGMILVVRFVTALVVKAVMLAALAGLGVALWVQRDDLGDCATTCSCRVFGIDVDVPADRNPNCR